MGLGAQPTAGAAIVLRLYDVADLPILEAEDFGRWAAACVAQRHHAEYRSVTRAKVTFDAAVGVVGHRRWELDGDCLRPIVAVNRRHVFRWGDVAAGNQSGGGG